MRIVLFAAFVAASLQGQAQEIAELTLKEAQDYALKNAYSVKSANYDALSAKLNSDALLGTGLPQVSASLQYNNYIDLPTSLVPAQFFGGPPGEYAKLRFGVPQNVTAGISASQLLFNGTWLVGLEASRAYAELQKKNINRSQVEIRNSVAQMYYVALVARKNEALLKESREVLSKMLGETEQLHQQGFVELQDVEQLQLALNDLDVKVSNAGQQTSITLDVLKFSMGMPLQTELRLKEDIDALVADNSLELVNSAFAVENNIDYLLVQDAKKMQELNLKAEKSKLLPSAAAFYNLQAQAQRDEFNFFDTSLPWFPIQLWGIQISVPIFSGMSKSKNIEIAKVSLQQSTDLVNMTRESKLLEYNNAKSAYRNAFETHQSAKASMQLSNNILEKTRIKYKEGLSSSFDISQAQTQAIQAQGQYIGSMIELLNAKTALLKILNQL